MSGPFLLSATSLAPLNNKRAPFSQSVLTFIARIGLIQSGPSIAAKLGLPLYEFGLT